MNNKIEKREYEKTYLMIKKLMEEARKSVSRTVNQTLLHTYHEIGRTIIEDEQGHLERAEYGRFLIDELSKDLTRDFGRGFSRSNLFNMRRFYLTFPIIQTLSGKLTWSHYCELLGIEDDCKRSFYQIESENANWSVRELKRQIKTSLYERLLLSKEDGHREEVLKLASSGHKIDSPKDIVKDPYVFEFLGIPEDKPMLESDLEKALIRQMERFLLELGKGFMYVGSQQIVTLGNTHYYVDMVFYNKILRSYILIELKTGKLVPETVGQLNMYLNYYKTEINDEYDDEPIGIILCTDKDHIQAEYALGGLSNQIFTSKYTLYIPNREELEKQVQKVLEGFQNQNQ